MASKKDLQECEKKAVEIAAANKDLKPRECIKQAMKALNLQLDGKERVSISGSIIHMRKAGKVKAEKTKGEGDEQVFDRLLGLEEKIDGVKDEVLGVVEKRLEGVKTDLMNSLKGDLGLMAQDPQSPGVKIAGLEQKDVETVAQRETVYLDPAIWLYYDDLKSRGFQGSISDFANDCIKAFFRDKGYVAGVLKLK